MPPSRQGAETFPWAALVAAVDRSFTQRFPPPTRRGRPPVSTRVLWAGEVLKPALPCSDEQLCSRLRPDLAVMSAWGLRAVQVEGSQEPVVLPEVRAQFRRRLDAPVREAWLALQAASAMEDGLVSPAPVVVDPFPREQGRPRVNDAARLAKAPNKASSASSPSRASPPPRAPRGRRKPSHSGVTWRSVGAASAAPVGGEATWW